MNVMQAYLASAVVLGFNVVLLAQATAVTRAKAKEVINPEDTKLNDAATVVFDEGNDRTARIRRAHRNALENVPLFLTTGYLLTLTGISFGLAATLFGIFVVFRLVHSITYVGSIQPWRTASFGISNVTQMVMLGYLFYAAFVA